MLNLDLYISPTPHTNISNDLTCPTPHANISNDLTCFRIHGCVYVHIWCHHSQKYLSREIMVGYSLQMKSDICCSRLIAQAIFLITIASYNSAPNLIRNLYLSVILLLRCNKENLSLSDLWVSSLPCFAPSKNAIFLKKKKKQAHFQHVQRMLGRERFFAELY